LQSKSSSHQFFDGVGFFGLLIDDVPEGLHLFVGVGFFGLLKEFCDVGFEAAFAMDLSP
jgi:hypothetical protein